MNTQELRKENKQAMEAHTNLFVFSSLIAILEGGCICGPNKTAEKIIELCKKETHRQLKIMDTHIGNINV